MLGDAAEPFQIDMQEIADVRPLVALDWGRGLDERHAIEADARQDPRDGRSRDAQRRADLPRGGPPTAQRHNGRFETSCYTPRLAMGPRRPIRQLRLASTRDPLRDRADAQTQRGRIWR